jgi:hypothetical protein
MMHCIVVETGLTVVPTDDTSGDALRNAPWCGLVKPQTGAAISIINMAVITLEP